MPLTHNGEQNGRDQKISLSLGLVSIVFVLYLGKAMATSNVLVELELDSGFIRLKCCNCPVCFDSNLGLTSWSSMAATVTGPGLDSKCVRNAAISNRSSRIVEACCSENNVC